MKVKGQEEDRDASINVLTRMWCVSPQITVMLLWRPPCPGLPSPVPQSCLVAMALALQVLIAGMVSLQLFAC